MNFHSIEPEFEDRGNNRLGVGLSKAHHKTNDDFEFEPSFKGSKVKILTQNMFLRPVVKTNASDYKYERLEEFAACVDDYDIICNQEVFDGLNTFKPTLFAIANKTGFTDIHHSPRPGFFESFAIDAGLVILSRFPILERDDMTFTKYTGDCVAGKKGTIFAKVSINGHYLYLFNTHLQANYYNTFEIYKECINTKMYQLKQLTEFIDSKTEDMRPDDLILVVGDFNISSRKFNSILMDQFREKASQDPGFKTFLEPGFDCVYEYKIMMKLLSKEGYFKVTDLKEGISDENGGPATFGGVEILEDDTKAPIETALTAKHDLMSEQSIDFIFKFERASTSKFRNDIERNICPEESDLLCTKTQNKCNESFENELNAKFGIIPKSIKVEKILVEDKGFTTISDHFGLSVCLNYNNSY